MKVEELINCSPMNVHRAHPFVVCRTKADFYTYMLYDTDRKIILIPSKEFDNYSQAFKEAIKHIDELIDAKKRD